jgi:uncharacterized protein (TIGR02611 family)
MSKKLPKIVRQIIVLTLGIPVIIVGIILLPLPGPGWLIILSGLYIISREFAWAKKYIDYIEAKLRLIANKVKEKHKQLQEDQPKK